MKNIAMVVEETVKKYFALQKDHITDSNLYAIVLKEVERPLFEQTLQAVGGNKTKAAHILGINRNTLHKKLTEIGL